MENRRVKIRRGGGTRKCRLSSWRWPCSRATHFDGLVNVHWVPRRYGRGSWAGRDESTGREGVDRPNDVGSPHFAGSCELSAAGFYGVAFANLAAQELEEDSEFGLLERRSGVCQGLQRYFR